MLPVSSLPPQPHSYPTSKKIKSRGVESHQGTLTALSQTHEHFDPVKEDVVIYAFLKSRQKNHVFAILDKMIVQICLSMDILSPKDRCF